MVFIPINVNKVKLCGYNVNIWCLVGVNFECDIRFSLASSSDDMGRSKKLGKVLSDSSFFYVRRFSVSLSIIRHISYVDI